MQNSRFLRSRLMIVSAALLVIPVAYAQPQGGGGTGGGSVGGSIGTGRGTTSSLPTSSEESKMPEFPEARGPVFLQGKVVLDSGEPAPPNVVIERVCAGRVVPEGYTDPRGQFSFEVGRNS